MIESFVMFLGLLSFIILYRMGRKRIPRHCKFSHFNIYAAIFFPVYYLYIRAYWRFMFIFSTTIGIFALFSIQGFIYAQILGVYCLLFANRDRWLARCRSTPRENAVSDRLRDPLLIRQPDDPVMIPISHYLTRKNRARYYIFKSLSNSPILILIILFTLIFYYLGDNISTLNIPAVFRVHISIALLLGVLILFSIGNAFKKRYQRLVQPGADAMLASWKREPILVLRSFLDDNIKYTASIALKKALPSIGELATLIRQILGGQTFENHIVEALGAYAPVVIIGKPDEEIPPLGAARRYVAQHEDWKEVVESYIDIAQLVIIVLGETDGYLWEIGKIFGADNIEKTIFVVPPRSQAILSNRWEIFKNKIKEVNKYIQYKEDFRIEEILLFTISMDGKIHAVKGRPNALADYEKALEEIFYKKSSQMAKPVSCKIAST